MAERPTRREVLKLTGAGAGAAVAGVGSVAAQSSTEGLLRIETVGRSGFYTVEVRNDLEPVEGRESPNREIQTTEEGNSVVDETVGSGADTFRFDGELDVVRYSATSEDIRATMDGEPVDLGSMVETNTLTVGTAPDPDVLDGIFDLSESQFPEAILGNAFELEAESNLEPSGALRGSVRGGRKAVDGNVATGRLGPIDTGLSRQSRVSFTYDGELRRFASLSDPAVAFLNGRALSQLADTVSTHTLTIISNTGENVPYELEVEGNLRKATPLSYRFPERSTANDGDTIDETVVDGSVRGGWDSYEFTGDLESLSVFGDATVWLDGRVLDVSRTRLTIDGNGEPYVPKRGNATSYDFEVTNNTPAVASGAVPKIRTVGSGEPGDVVDGAEASGRVFDGRDAYEIVGELVRFTADGNVDVELNGEPISPADVVTEHTVTYFEDVFAPNSPFSVNKYRLGIDPSGTLRNDDALRGEQTSRETDEEVGALRENFVKGAVPGSPDSYVFSGEVTWSVAGDAVIVVLDGEEVTAEELAKQ